MKMISLCICTIMSLMLFNAEATGMTVLSIEYMMALFFLGLSSVILTIPDSKDKK